jgi:L-methionine (R)-S-oxide reductase
MKDAVEREMIMAIVGGDEARATRAAALAEAVRAAGRYRWVGIYDVGSTEVSVVAWSGGGPPAYPRFPRGQGITARAVDEARTIVVNDVSSDSAYLEALTDTGSELIVPVVIEGIVRGTIDIESAKRDAFDGEDVVRAERWAESAEALWK